MTTEVNVAAGYGAESGEVKATELAALGIRLSRYGKEAVRFAVAGVLGWIGAMKFTAYEAGAIEGLVASSPLTSWLYGIYSLQGAANLIGGIEIATALLIVAGTRFPKAAIPRGGGNRVSPQRVYLHDHHVPALAVVNQRVDRRVAHVATIPISLPVNFDRLKERR